MAKQEGADPFKPVKAKAKTKVLKQGLNKPKTNWSSKNAVNRPKTVRSVNNKLF